MLSCLKRGDKITENREERLFVVALYFSLYFRA